MNKPRKHAELIKAWADGAIIEAFNNHKNCWVGILGNNPPWLEDAKYRIKPEPKWYDNIPEQGILCFVSDESEAAGVSSRNIIVIASTEMHDGVMVHRAYQGSYWKYARPVIFEEIQHLIYKESKCKK